MRTDDVKSRQIYPKFDFGDVVYHRTAKEERKGIIVGWNVRPGGIQYVVAWDAETTEVHFDIELTTVFVKEWGETNVDE